MSSLFIDLEGRELSSEEKELLRHPFVSGVILFSRNFENKNQLEKLVREIRLVRTPSLLISVDQEGGIVQRFKSGFSRLPSLGAVGDQFEKTPEWCRALTRDHACVMATELLEVGIDFSFAPVVDLRNSSSTVIDDRAFHGNPKVVASLASVYVETMTRCGMSAVAKHFPGHGLVVGDSHVTLPVDARPFSEIFENDIVPYRQVITTGLTGIMMAHVLYTAVDERAAGYSKIWIKEILRDRLGFEGIIFSDDLNMTGADLGSSYVERAGLALEAGCDCLLMCNNRLAVEEILDSKIAVVDEMSHGNDLEKMRGTRSREGGSTLDQNLKQARVNLRDILSS